MRFKLILYCAGALLLGCAFYLTLLLTSDQATGHASASAQAAPTLTSQQLATIQAINSLLLDDDPAIVLPTQPYTPAHTLVLLYVNGDNDLAAYMHKLVRNVHIGTTNPNVITTLVLDWPNKANLGPANSYRYVVDRRGDTTCNFQEDYTCEGRYIPGKTVTAFPEDLGDPDNLREFIETAMREYPDVKQVALALVGHGGGWSPNLRAGQPKWHGGKPGEGDLAMGGLLWDDYTGNGPGNSLSTLDLHDALRDAVTNSGRKIDLLYLDACLMGMWEVAHEVRKEVNYVLASESWSWTSFAYDDHLRAINSTQNAARIGAAWLQNEAAILRADRYPFTYGLIDTAQLTATTTSIDLLAQELISATVPADVRVKNAFAASECFDSNADHIINRDNPSAGKLDNYCDLASFAEQLQQPFSNTPTLVSAAQAVQSAVASTVISETHGCGVPGDYSNIPWCWQQLGGLSIYTPLGEDENKRGLYTQLQVAQDTHWDEFINQYWDNATEPTLQACPAEGCSLPDGPLKISYPVYLPVVSR